MSTPLRPRTTTAFYVQSAVSFAVSLTVTITGIGYLHDSRWVRAFLALGLLYVVTSTPAHQPRRAHTLPQMRPEPC